MTTGSILFGIAILVGVLLFVARPYLVETRPQTLAAPSRRQQLLLQKDVLLEQLRQMDFDHETGKIDPEVYERSRPRLLEQAALILKQLDDMVDAHADATIEATVNRLRGKTAHPTPQRPTVPHTNGHAAAPADSDIEAAISRRRHVTHAPPPTVQPTEPLVAAPEAVTAAPITGKDRFCAQCGRPLEPDDKFCPRCGRRRG